MNKKVQPLFQDPVFLNFWFEQMKIWEGVRSRMYLDIYGLPTIGIGTLIDTPEEQYLKTANLTNLEIKALFEKDSAYMFKDLSKYFGNQVQTWTIGQAIAICSLWFNYGEGTFRKLLHVQYIKNNGFPKTKKDFEYLKSLWVRPLKNPQLVGRRNKEMNLAWNSGRDYV